MTTQPPTGSRRREQEPAAATEVVAIRESRGVYLVKQCLEARERQTEADVNGDRNAAWAANIVKMFEDLRLITEVLSVLDGVEGLTNDLRRKSLPAGRTESADGNDAIEIWEIENSSVEKFNAIIRTRTNTVQTKIAGEPETHNSLALYMEDGIGGLIRMELSEEPKGKRTFTLTSHKGIGLKDASSLESEIPALEGNILLSGQNSGMPQLDVFNGDEKPYYVLSKIHPDAATAGLGLDLVMAFAKQYSAN